MSARRLRYLRGYGPVVALATAFLAVSALTVPAHRLQLTVGVDAGGAGTAGPTGEAAAPVASGAAASGGAAGGGTGSVAGPATTRSSGPVAPRRVARPGRAGSAGSDEVAGEPLGAVTPCSDRARQIPKDPYSTPCMAFAGNNGGATSRGVTRDTIRLGIRFPADPIDFGQAYQFLADHGIHETRDDVERTARGLLDYFNATFQFYGRKIEPVIWQGSGLAAQEILGGGQDAANADAIKAATELNVFADASAFTPPYADALVKQHVVAVGAPYMSRKWYADRAPYAWSITPDCSLLAETAGELYVKQLLGKPAQYAGAGLQGKPRKLALIGPDVPWYQECISDGIRRIKEAGGDVPLRIAYSLDPSVFTSQAASIIAKLKDEGVTSVACGCDPILPVFLTAKASEQNYEPEWLVLGTALTDTDIMGQFYNPQQWRHAFGISLIGPQQPVRASLGYRAYKSVRTDEPSITVDLLYYFIYVIAIGIQMAGPDLTPTTFQQGMFNYPRATGPAGSWGFGPGDYTPMDDAMVIWWNPDADSPYNGKRGAYQSDGKRYRPGQWPREPIPVHPGGAS
ncbi:MAG TPA: ABC transporter substrate-binding protein [Acidimicrobiia bacterium]|nr:ABC transporter substrate-binding protein [Acidimicrobiia bacterium]